MRRRRTAPEEHENHERWLVSYADFVTLLFAFFVVMYSVSSVNEGKFRVLADTMVAAFKDPARSLKPIQVGKLVRSPYTADPRPLKVPVAVDLTHHGRLGKGDAPLAAKGTDPDARGSGKKAPHPDTETPAKEGLDPGIKKPGKIGTGPDAIGPGKRDGAHDAGRTDSKTSGSRPTPAIKPIVPKPGAPGGDPQAPGAGMAKLGAVATKVEQEMAPLIDQGLVKVRKKQHWLEVEFNTSLLFASGSAQLAPEAIRVLASITDILKEFPNPVQVEGHTDNVPIRTTAFPSNWELSAARAASVVHLFTKAGVHPGRMVAIGYGEYRSIADNHTPEGRRKNRRVLLVIPATSNARRILDLQRLDSGGSSPPSTLSGASAPVIDRSGSDGANGLQPQPG